MKMWVLHKHTGLLVTTADSQIRLFTPGRYFTRILQSLNFILPGFVLIFHLFKKERGKNKL